MQAFLLTRQWRDSREGIALDLWFASDAGPIYVEITGQEGIFFVAESDLPAVEALFQALAVQSAPAQGKPRFGDVRLKNRENEPVLPLYFQSQRQLRQAAQALDAAGIRHWEADLRPTERFLMERFITGAARISGEAAPGKLPVYRNPQLQAAEYRPRLKVISLDIETSMDASALYSIAVYGSDVRRVFMVGAEASDDPALSIVRCEDQASCLRLFLRWLASYDPDVLIGWNVVQFDLWVLEKLCEAQKLRLTLGRRNQPLNWREDEYSNRRYAHLPGRVVLDGIELLKAANERFQSYSLEAVSRQVLGEGKLLASADRGWEITELFHRDKQRLAEYNLKDCELVWDIFEQRSLLDFAIERAQLTGLPLDRMGGSVAAFEYAYLPLLHRKGYIAPNLGEVEADFDSPGGYVLDSEPGLYRNVLVLDFKSLYPSIIRSFRVDPYSFWYAEHAQVPDQQIVPGFRGAVFARDEHILPGVIERLWQARDRAKAEGNGPLSHAIKIIMNSFYGVLGSTGCRFYDPRVCSSITLRGHDIIQSSKRWIEEEGHRVIYGDTDSLFVWVGDETSEAEARRVGSGLAARLNQRWEKKLREELAIDSALEIQFETHYLQFVMPTIRGSELGSKKRYAGIVREDGRERLVFKGLENVRTDWTDLAKSFQEELYRRVFAGESVEDFIRETTASVWARERDEQLVYRKRLRRKLSDYEKNVPPHVQAARKLQQQGISLHRGDWIEYLITVKGPEPLASGTMMQNGFIQSPIDYSHYVERQLAPVADGILHFLGLNFAELTKPQLNLF